jgi:glycosyltransferase involved in cell wall biosynthesis
VRIAVVHNLPSGGARRALVEHCRGLRALGHTIEAFSPDTADEAFLPLGPVVDRVHDFRSPLPPGREASLFGGPGLRTAAHAARLLRALYRIHREMADLVDRGGFDVVLAAHDQFTHAPLALRYLRTPAAYFCQEPLRFVHDAPVGLAVRPRGRLGRWVRGAATAVVRHLLGPIDATNVAAARVVLANSVFSHESILRAYGRPARVVYLGVDAERFRPLDVAREAYVLSVGALHPAKGFEFVVAALGRLPADRRPRLVIASDRGYGVLRDALERHARERGVQMEIRARVPEAELVGLYCRASAVVYAPYLEPFGLVPLEAMACGTAVVAVAEGGVRESVEPGVSGLLVARDESAFARAVAAVLCDAELAHRLGTAGRAAVRERWTWAASCRQLEAALRECAELGRG